MNGALFRRSIALRRVDMEQVVGSVQDDFHHFELWITHRNGIVRSVDARTLRAPWSTCPGAANPLRHLVGAALIERASDVGRLIDMRAQCTHMFDLAGLLLSLAWRDDAALAYDAFVVVDDDGIEAQLECDGQTVLQWTREPPVSLGRGFREWTEALAVAPAEHAFVLRRAVFVAGGRRKRLDERASADDLGLPVDVCYSLGKLIRQQATRTIGTRIDFARAVHDQK